MVQWFALSTHSNRVPVAFYLMTAGRGSRPPRPRIGKAIKRMDSKPAQGNDKFTSVLFFKKRNNVQNSMEYPVLLKGVQKSDSTAFVNIISRRNYKFKVRCSTKSDATVVVVFFLNQKSNKRNTAEKSDPRSHMNIRDCQIQNEDIFHSFPFSHVAHTGNGSLLLGGL